MKTQIGTAVGILTLCAAASGSAQPLGVGDPAPAIQVKEFLKGAPVSGLEKGQRYVVEFWATWCGPCRMSIPHLTELHKKHPEITFIGVSVWEQDQKGVKPFVQQMGDKMAYTVAMDDVPEGAKGDAGKMAKAWMEAAGQEGIPTAFLVDRDGKIAWIGHPMGLDQPLEKLAAGQWDVSAARAQFQKDQAQRRKMRELEEKLAKAQQSGDPQQKLAALDEAISTEPALEATLGITKYMVLAREIKAADQAQAYGSHLVNRVLTNNPRALNQIAWLIVSTDPPQTGASAVKLALSAALRADKLAQGKEAGIADTLAKVYFASGNPSKALETQERAVRLAKDAPPEITRDLNARLEQYRKAARSRQPAPTAATTPPS